MVVVPLESAGVSGADGGGFGDSTTDARHRKHSPLPKYLGLG